MNKPNTSIFVMLWIGLLYVSLILTDMKAQKLEAQIQTLREQVSELQKAAK